MADRGKWLEAGLALFAVVLLAGIVILVGGRTAGGVRRGLIKRSGPPEPGAVPPERHRARGVVSSR